MKKASLIIAILATALLFFAACANNDDNGNGEEPTPDPAPVTQDPVADTDTDSDPAPEPEIEPEPSAPTGNIHPVSDFGGRTMMFSGHLPFSGVWGEPDPATAGNYLYERLQWDNAQRLQRDFNFTIENLVIEYSDVLPLLTTTTMAGDAMADIVNASATVWLPAGFNGFIHPIDTLNVPNSDILGAQTFGHMRGWGLGHYWIVGSNEPNHDGLTLGINQDIIAAIGAPNPIELYETGQWTWDALLDIMRLATRDTTGDGVLDQWGIAGQPGDIVVNFFVGSNDGVLVSDDFQYAFDHPNTIEALEFADTIFRENLWQFDPAEGPHGGWGVNFWAHNQGRAAFFVSHTWNLSGGDLPFAFNVVPFPLGPSNTSGNTWLGNDRHGQAFATASSWAPEDLLVIVDELWSWAHDEPEMLIDYGLAWSRGVFHYEADVQRQISANRTRNVDYGMIVPEYFWVFGTFVNHMIYQDMTVMQMIEAYRAPQQERLDHFFGGN